MLLCVLVYDHICWNYIEIYFVNMMILASIYWLCCQIS